jgi:hypothetical protein
VRTLSPPISCPPFQVTTIVRSHPDERHVVYYGLDFLRCVVAHAGASKSVMRVVPAVTAALQDQIDRRDLAAIGPALGLLHALSWCDIVDEPWGSLTRHVPLVLDVVRAAVAWSGGWVVLLRA